ncbi:MAG: replicative DNA helicase [Clostridiales bacterium]|nr:replicative DNA helicase [Clostridiales bacterium]
MEQKRQTKAKMMPHSMEAEQSVLGACLIDDEAANSIMNTLTKDDFYLEAHQEIFSAMYNIFAKNQPIDYVTLTDELDNGTLLQSIGGLEYITKLTNVLPSAANFKVYVDIVKRDSVLRKIIRSSQNIIENTYDSSDKEEAIDFAEQVIFEIGKEEETSSLVHIGGALADVIKKFDTLSKNKDGIKGISTGFKEFDAVTNGLQNSDLILLAARPGVGKTSFAMNIITNAAVKEKKKCAIFSLEMPRIQIAQRAVCSVASVSMAKALKGNLAVDEWKSLWTANKQLTEAGIFIDDSSMNTPMSILSKCRRLKREQGLDLVMIDYLQLMSSGKSKVESRQNEVSEMTRYLKIAARELNIPIIVLSQLSRAVEQRKGDHKPQLSDLRESGSIEQDADIVLFIYKPDMYNDVVNEDEPGICTLSIAKHRNGELKDIKLRWIGEYTTFVDRDKRPNIAKNENRIRVVDDNAYGDIPPEEEQTGNFDEVKDLFKPEEE